MEAAASGGSTLVSGLVSASEGDDPDLDFSSMFSSDEGEGSIGRTGDGEADMEVERRGALGISRCLVRWIETRQELEETE